MISEDLQLLEFKSKYHSGFYHNMVQSWINIVCLVNHVIITTSNSLIKIVTEFDKIR